MERRTVVTPPGREGVQNASGSGGAAVLHRCWRASKHSEERRLIPN
jgi:hypothetical protein